MIPLIKTNWSNSRQMHAELFANPRVQEVNVNKDPVNDNVQEDQAEAQAEVQADDHPAGVSISDVESQVSESQRPTRERSAPTIFTYAKPGEPSLTQTVKTKSVVFNHQDILKDLEQCHNISGKPGKSEEFEYDSVMTGVAARLIYECYLQYNVHSESSLAQQYILQEGLKLFGDRGKAAAKKEMNQLHDRVCFVPIDISE